MSLVPYGNATCPLSLPSFANAFQPSEVSFRQDFIEQDMVPILRKKPCVTWLGWAYDWAAGNTECYITDSNNDESTYVHENSKLYKDERSLLRKCTHLMTTLVREIKHGVSIVSARIRDRQENTYEHCNSEKTWNEDSEGCVVFLTGLNGHPSTWKYHLEKLESERKIDRFIPYVPHGGNCPLEEAAQPIYEVVKDYAKRHPGKPICLIGVSNGARIATYIETKLRHEAPATPVKVSTIAGVHFGSILADFYKSASEQRPLVKKLVSCNSTVIEELRFGSEKAKELLQEVQKPLPAGVKRSYQFYAATEDFYTWELRTSIPKLGPDITSTYCVLNGHGHNSIVDGVADQQMAECLHWIKPDLI